ncbi:MAG: 3'(2'),5'-bisphosphate nucleotidase [Thermoanaerobaculales bacterium]|jgi:3'(2'), 5'-bisphosphate nucleotidase|nr:3'(2'),5'-bisphosphate nucleotidase [Thermoanaerobaculales bacterium]
MYTAELELARALVAEACTLTRRVQAEIVSSGESLAKGDRSPVTVADLAVQALAGSRLTGRFPDDGLLAEEDSAPLAASPTLAARVLELVRGSLPGLAPGELAEALDRGAHPGGARGRHWVLDPVDGTKGFLRGEQYAIALALVEDGRVVVGALGCPNLPRPGERGVGEGFLFHASVGGGAWATPLEGAGPVEIRVDRIDDPAGAVVCESVEAAHAAHSTQAGIARRLGITAVPYRIDSQCKYAVLARGEASVYLRLPRDESYREKVWDHAAGALVITEAGGRVSDLDGNPLDFSAGRRLATGRGIVATNGILHGQVLEACRAELSG